MHVKFYSLFVVLNFLMTYSQTGSAPIFSLQTCDGGCRSTDECPDNAACIPLLGQSCGLCLCTLGFSANGDRCVYNGPLTSSSGSGSDGNSSKFIEVIDSNIVKKNELSRDQINGTTSRQVQLDDDWNCDQYKCESASTSDTETNGCPESTSVPCPNLVGGGGECLSGNCTEAKPGKDYCICPYGKTSRTCHVHKLGDCSLTTGVVPAESSYTGAKKRFVNPKDPDYGAVLSRHFAKSLSHCIRLCQWATASQCRSVNYGPINGKMVCELLTVWASPDSSLFKWLRNENNWTYVCCFK